MSKSDQMPRSCSSPRRGALGIKIDNELEFDEYILHIYFAYIYALHGLGKYLNLQQREVLDKSFILTNYIYCLVVWHFCSCKNTTRMERIYKRALKFMLNDFTSYHETLMAKANTSTRQKVKKFMHRDL